MNEAEEILALALRRPATLGTGRLICLDGPSGSGKSTVARAIAAITPATLVHTDDLCPGWDGIPELPRILHTLLAPLAHGATGRYPRHDWILGHPVEDTEVAPAPLVVLEGVGAGAAVLAPMRTVLVHLDAPAGLRRERALTRDGEYFAAFWEAWAAAEAEFFARDRVAECADLVFTT